MGACSRLLLVALSPQRPLTTALELIGAGLRSARRLPEQAGRLPFLGIDVALTVADTVRREYRAVREDGWVAAVTRGRHDEGTDVVRDREESPLGWPEESAQESWRPRAVAEAAAKAPPGAAREVGAPGTATEIVERVEAELADAVPDAAALDAADLPVPDYDHLTLGSLRARMRRLSLPELLMLREYEKGHADRLQVVTMLDNRIAKLEIATESAGASEIAAEGDIGPGGEGDIGPGGEGDIGSIPGGDSGDRDARDRDARDEG